MKRNLNKLIYTKWDIKDSLEEKAVVVDVGMAGYGDKIRGIRSILKVVPGTKLGDTRIYPLIDLSLMTDVSNLFVGGFSNNDDPGLSVDMISTSHIQNMNHMFYNCAIKELGLVDMSSVTDSYQMFVADSFIIDLDVIFRGFKNLKSGIDLSMYVMSVDSFINIANTVYDWTANPENLTRGNYNKSGLLAINYRVNELLSSQHKKLFTDKGWTISVKS